MSRLKAIAIAAAILAGYAIVGTMDYNDTVAIHE